MCECCGGDCKLCANPPQYGYFEVPFEIIEVYSRYEFLFLFGPNGEVLRLTSEDIENRLKENKSMEFKPNYALASIDQLDLAKNKLKNILDQDIFDNLSKFNEKWHHKHPEIDQQLDEVRRELICLHDNLWDLWAILRKDEE